MESNVDEAKKTIIKAVTFDNEGEYRKALSHYNVAIRLLAKISTTSMFAIYLKKIEECKSRISFIKKLSRLLLNK